MQPILEQPKILDYDKVNGEERWTYYLNITFNYHWVEKLTITSHWQTKPGREMITKELIWNIFKTKLPEKETLRPTSYYGKREGRVFIWEEIYQEKEYRLYFWYEDSSITHLWVRNIHRIDPKKNKNK